ncbi:hypothetical protein HAX54_048057 [Datura stramonium]|uniref:Uncharacterized protein n=1 Tax=Datura stramonium TaxID=4076 RepID=A0ABS8WL07_DATST|nr:hypothetical protein [Datura stramonium]
MAKLIGLNSKGPKSQLREGGAATCGDKMIMAKRVLFLILKNIASLLRCCRLAPLLANRLYSVISSNEDVI